MIRANFNGIRKSIKKVDYGSNGNTIVRGKNKLAVAIVIVNVFVMMAIVDEIGDGNTLGY